jgi:Flp pilus assembly protein TadG
VEEQNCQARQRMLRKQKRQRGQALVEFAVIMSFVLFPIFAGAVDLSNLLDSHLGIVYATRQAARVGAEEDQNPVADCAVLGSIYAATQNLSLVTVTRIVIFQIDSTGTITGNKDVYAGNPGCPTPPNPPITANPNTWNPAVTPSVRNDSPPTEDSIGIEIDYTYSWQTGFIATGNFTGTDQTIMKLNPVV